jgi:hypothetical protein
MPKQELYFKLEKELAKQGIEINEQNIDEGVFSLTIDKATVYYKGINVLNIEKIDFFTLLFYSKLQINDLLLDDSLKEMAPQKTDKLILSSSLVSPLSIAVDAKGVFGVVSGDVALKERKLHLDFLEAQEIEMIKSHLKKDEKGWHYETSF